MLGDGRIARCLNLQLVSRQSANYELFTLTWKIGQKMF